ncbi:hypothetical protein LINPERPRIM_LOCUS6674 [Linum perenne]
MPLSLSSICLVVGFGSANLDPPPFKLLFDNGFPSLIVRICKATLGSKRKCRNHVQT